MAEYIEKDALVRMLRAKAEMGRLSEYSVCFDNVAKMIELLPAADVAEVKHGKWLNFYNDFSTAECSECAECFEVSPDEKPKKEFFEAFKEFYHYCPNCGAKMGLED